LVYFNLASVCADSRDCRFYFTFFFQFLCGCFLDGCYALKISFFPSSVSPFPPLSPLNLSYLWAVTKNFCVMLFSKVISMDKSLLFDLLRSMKRSSLSNFCFGFFVQFLYSLSINWKDLSCLVIDVRLGDLLLCFSRQEQFLTHFALVHSFAGQAH